MTTDWTHFKSQLLWNRDLQCGLDVSRVNFPDGFFEREQGRFAAALDAMGALEAGAIANPDEDRMVGHYWLRDPNSAPKPELTELIESAERDVQSFADAVHKADILSESGKPFQSVLLIGIGGSALGPQFVYHALRGPDTKLKAFFFDNTDPDGMQRVLGEIPSLAETLVLVVSKSGGTKETRNGQLIAKAAFRAAGLDPSKAFVAVTGVGSELDKQAVSEGWLARFPMWDWVGGRTSLWSAVGLLPMALLGFNIQALLRGANAMDAWTRTAEVSKNPAALLALTWLHAAGGDKRKAMVVLPYRDRLELFSRYLQQLVMESLGKELDLAGNTVHEGLVVYGNKGSTDQHAYVQQLRDGPNNFFAAFVEVLDDTGPGASPEALKRFSAVDVEVDPGVTAGDYLEGFYQGTRQALYDRDRESVTITVGDVSEFSIGMLIALFERAVGFYASMVNINAYHQPGVEAGKRAAQAVLALQAQVLECLSNGGAALSVEQIAEQIGSAGSEESIYLMLRRLVYNGRVVAEVGENSWEDMFSLPKGD